MLDLALATRLLEAVPRLRACRAARRQGPARVRRGRRGVRGDRWRSDAERRDARGARRGDRHRRGRIASPAPVAPDAAARLRRLVHRELPLRAPIRASAGSRRRSTPATRTPRSSWLRAAADASVTWIEDDARTPCAGHARRASSEGYRTYLEAVRAGAEPAALFAAFDRFRVLCARAAGAVGRRRHQRGDRAMVPRHARSSRCDPGPRSAWYPGRPVMVAAQRLRAQRVQRRHRRSCCPTPTAISWRTCRRRTAACARSAPVGCPSTTTRSPAPCTRRRARSSTKCC